MEGSSIFAIYSALSTHAAASSASIRACWGTVFTLASKLHFGRTDSPAATGLCCSSPTGIVEEADTLSSYTIFCRRLGRVSGGLLGNALARTANTLGPGDRLNV